MWELPIIIVPLGSIFILRRDDTDTALYLRAQSLLSNVQRVRSINIVLCTGIYHYGAASLCHSFCLLLFLN